MTYTRLKKSDVWHWHPDCSHFPKKGAKVLSQTKPTNGELCDECQAKDRVTLPDAVVIDGAVVDVAPERVTVDTSDGSPVTLIATDAPPTGVRSPATREIDNNLLSTVLDRTPGTPVPALVTAPPTQPESVRVVAVEGVEGVARIVPNVPPSVETRGPLVPLVPLNAVHPSTVEAAISDQRIPNDQIHGVFEDADGVKRDALGHVFTPDPTRRVVPPMTGKGF